MKTPSLRPSTFIALLIVIVPICFFIILFFWNTFFQIKMQKSIQPTITTQTLSFHQLPGWAQQDHRKSFDTFLKSCKVMSANRYRAAISQPIQISHATWQRICGLAKQIDAQDRTAVTQFFETHFTPIRFINGKETESLLTGYYLPTINAQEKRSNTYPVPIYGKPSDLVTVSLGSFMPEFSGRYLRGQLKEGGVLKPYPDRATINSGKIDKQAPVLVWIQNKFDRFFMQIQGSGLAKLPNGKLVLLNYANDNGRPYTSIGKVLLARGELTKQTVSMQSIRRWLSQHPKEADEVMNQNASFVFFQILPGEDPIGFQQVPLSSGYSLAVDRHYIPLGVPVWVNISLPKKQNPSQNEFLQRLFIAQDTGGAIKGPLRADLYFGAGNNAAWHAGHLNTKSVLWLLIPT